MKNKIWTLMSVIVAIATVVLASIILKGMIDSGLSLDENNPIFLVTVLVIGGGLSLFLLGGVKRVFTYVGAYYVGALLSIALLYHAALCIIYGAGIGYAVGYIVLSAIPVGVAHMIVDMLKIVYKK